MTEPDMQWVDSTSVEEIGYDSDAEELFIRFVDGLSVYVYTDVPLSTFEELMRAPSKGSYLNREIKPNYQFRIQ
jgi:hypothetical protein